MEVDTHAHPNPKPNLYHRKVELQSPLDLSYLQSNLIRSARAKLDLHFPPSASQPATHIPLDGSITPPSGTNPNETPEDPMRMKVQSLVTSFLDQTWTNASHSISINGIDAIFLPPTTKKEKEGEQENVDFTYTPFNPALQRKLASLHAEVETLTTQVSKLRRDAPRTAAKAHGERLGEMIEEDEQQQQQQQRETDGEQENVLNLDAVPDGWHEDVSQMYERGLDELRRLSGLGDGEGSGSGSLTETVGKARRARTVAMELET